MKTQIGLKQFRGEGCLSYLFFDPSSREAVVIDPIADLMEDYRDLVASNGLKLKAVLETHTHADHYSASHLFKKENSSVKIGMSVHSKSARADWKLKPGEKIPVGKLTLEVLETPGHTPDSISYFGNGMVFTGDTLFIGSSGRTDFPGADPKAQWNSIHNVLGALPGDTLVLPGHDYSDLLFSTIALEKSRNAHWLIPSLDAFVAMKNSESIPNASDEIKVRVDFNLAANPTQAISGTGAATACGIASRAGNQIAEISVQKYVHKMEEKAAGTSFIDVREAEEYREGHMPGAINIPLSELGLHLAELKNSKRVYVSCLSGRRSGMAVKTLNYAGLPDAVNVVGGYKAWTQAGFPVKK